MTLLTSSIAQGVNGLSVVNGQDDNDITINARTAFTQGARAGLVAGRNGNIQITADEITLDPRNRGLIRGFGELLLQPFTDSQAIVLGSSGAGFELTSGEWNAIGDTFTNVTVGRADGTHAITIGSSLTFRDSTLIRTPLAGGSVVIGSGAAPITLLSPGRKDNFRIESAGAITLDGNIRTSGSGTLELLADFDADGDGDLIVGQNLGKPNKSVSISSDFGAIRLQGENILFGKEILTQKDAGIVSVKSLGGAVSLRTNTDGDTDGGFTMRHLKSTVTAGGIASIISANHAGAMDILGGSVIGKKGVNITAFDSVTLNATKVTSDKVINIEAISATLKAKASLKSLTDIQIFGDQATGVIALEKGVIVSAVKSILLDAAIVQKDPGASVKAKLVTIDTI